MWKVLELEVTFIAITIAFLACNPNSQNETRTPGIPEASLQASLNEQLLKVLEAKDSAAIKDLVKKGLDPNAPFERGYPPLHCLAMNSLKCPYDKGVVSALIEAGADINKQITVDFIKNESPLHLAVANKSQPIVEDLLELGANPNLIGGEGSTLHMAVKRILKGSSHSLVELLLKNIKVDKNLKDLHNHTPLFYAHKKPSGKDLNIEDSADMEKIRKLFKSFGVVKYE